MSLNLTKNCSYLKKISIYENKTHFYLIGEHNLRQVYYIITIKKVYFKPESIDKESNWKLKDLLVEFKLEFKKEEYRQLVKELDKTEETRLKKTSKSDIYGIFGFVKFFLGYYLIVVQDTSKIGKINKYVINRVNKLLFIPLFDFSEIKKDKIFQLEAKYSSTFKGIDFEKQIFFSYTYNLTKSLQRNFIENLKGEILLHYESNFYKENNKENAKSNQKSTKETFDIKKVTNNYFLWNHYHIKEFFDCIDNRIWCIYFIYGFFGQTECIIYGQRFLVTLIGRRNRYFAGTRYLKRGVNNDGNVANDVETEQILEEISSSWTNQPNISSFIHIRGSVPIYWHQDLKNILPKPDIEVNLSDYEFDATKRHFYILCKRYGIPCLVCNLTKANENKKPQETLLNKWYKTGIEYINQNEKLTDDEKIQYIHYDLKELRKSCEFYQKFCDESCNLISKTNIFSFILNLMNQNQYVLSLQNGVIRSNCIDCLDRTNVYQQIIGTAVMLIQLRNFGIQACKPDKEDEGIFGILTELYKKMGNDLSSQYAGSLAHKQEIKDDKKKLDKFLNKFPEMFNTIKRYCSNSFNDQNKQNAINLFLGKYKISEGKPDIWNVQNDTDFHRKRKLEILGDDWAKKGMEYYQKYNLINDIVEKFSIKNKIITKKALYEMGREFQLETLEKISIKKYNLPIKILNSEEKDNSNFSEFFFLNNGKTFNYLITFDKYLDYKRMQPLKYQDQVLFRKEIPIFNFLDIEEKEQIKELDTINLKRPLLSKHGISHNINVIPTGNENEPIQLKKKNERIDNGNSDVLILYDEENDLFTSKQKENRNRKSEKKQIVNDEDNSDEEGEEDIQLTEQFNICPFEIEYDIGRIIKDFCNPDINNLGEFKEFTNFDKDEDILKFYDVDKEGWENDIQQNEFEDDILGKGNNLDIENRTGYYYDDKNGDKKQYYYIMRPKGYYKHRKKKKQESNKKKKPRLETFLQGAGIQFKIFEEHFA